jgi:hypothetical protein
MYIDVTKYVQFHNPNLKVCTFDILTLEFVYYTKFSMTASFMYVHLRTLTQFHNLCLKCFRFLPFLRIIIQTGVCIHLTKSAQFFNPSFKVTTFNNSFSKFHNHSFIIKHKFKQYSVNINFFTDIFRGGRLLI